MADTETYTTTEVPPGMEDEESVVNLSTLFLALLTLAVYILFLKPTAEPDNTNTPNNNNTPNRTGVRDRQRQRGRRQVAQPPPPPPSQQQQARRRLQLSDNALEVLQNSQSLPPHVPSSSASSKRTIGGFEMLSENGLVAFSHTKAAAESAASRTPRGSSSDNNHDPAKASASLLQRKQRAKILSRLFAATNIDTSKGLPAPPSKGSTFVIGISRAKHLLDSDQLASLIRVVKGLAIHYTVLLVVSLDAAASNESSSSSYESTQKLHAEAIGLLKGSSNDNDSDGTATTGLSESILPSHRILLAGSGKGRVAMVRQLSTNIGLTVDFDDTVREELERFGYEVSIVNDWKTILPAKEVVKA